MPILFFIVPAVVGWLIGINFHWIAQIFTIGLIWYGTIGRRNAGLEVIPLLAADIILTGAALIANVAYVIKHPTSMSWLSTVGGWFLP